MKKWAFILTAIIVGAVVWVVAKKAATSRIESPTVTTVRPYEGQELVVYAYSSFVSSWGAGPKIAERFTAITGAKVRFVDAGDTRLLQQKLIDEQNNPGADVWMGFDQNTYMEVRKKIELRNLMLADINWDPRIPKSLLNDSKAIPFDWSPLTFVYREGEIDPPRHLSDLKDPKYKGILSMLDPRTSSLGFHFLTLAMRTFSDSTDGFQDFFKSLRPNVFAYSPSWSTAYGIFKKSEAKLAWSYLTSPVYHWREEKDRRYKPVVFEEGHIAQIEYAVIPKSCQKCDVATAFAKFLLEPETQKILMTTNIMLPVIAGLTEGTEFAELPQVKLIEDGAIDQKSQEDWLKLWKKANP